MRVSAWARLPNMGASKTDDHDSPFLSTFAQLARSGLDHDEINRRIGAGTLRRVRSGVYAHEPEAAPAGSGPDYVLREREFLERTRAAALAVEPGTVMSHGSALALYGLPLHGIPLGRPTATRPREGGGTRRSSALVCFTLPVEGATRLVDGIQMTSPARTIIDVARTVSLESGVAAADQAIRRGMLSRPELQVEAGLAKGRTGVGRARALPELTCGLAESVLESLLRLILVFAGLPQPEMQVWLSGRSGKRFRVDFYWREWRLIGEADGFGKYGNSPQEIREALSRERHRQRDLEDAGYVVIRWVWDDLRRPDVIVRRVKAEMRRQERLGLGRAA